MTFQEEPRSGVPAAAYARNSRAPKGWKPSFEGERPPGSWETQLERAQAHARAEGDTIVFVGHDRATGADPNRPEWAKVMAGVRGGTIRRVYVTKLDRVMRSLAHFLEVAAMFEARGAELVFIDNPAASVRPSDAAGKALRGMLAVFAEFELDLARERTAAVMEKREDGRLYGPRSSRPAGGQVEYGPPHRMRRRKGRMVHWKERCAVCRGGMDGGSGPTRESVGSGRVA
jgi:DNA invertase Pin-like site-specific DNA recombinase